MASVTKTVKGYRVQVYVKGVRDSASFRTQREASAWGARRETEILADSKKTVGQKFTLKQALQKYLEEVVPSKRGRRMEIGRVTWMMEGRAPLPIDRPIGSITSTDIAAYRDMRLTVVKPGSVIREIVILSAVFEVARREWDWVTYNPVKDIRKPPSPKHRERLITLSEIRAMLTSLKYSSRGCRSVTESVAYAFLIALRTGIRAGEACDLKWSQVYEDHLKGVGTKTRPRDVALSGKAQRLIARLRGWNATYVVGIESAMLDALFRKHRKKAGLSGFTFHDTRHYAATKMAQKLSVLDLCKTFGWTNPAQAMSYYNPTASDISKRL